MSTVLFTRAVRGEGRYIRQPPGRFGHVILVVEPSVTSGLSFSWEVREEEIPRMFEAAIERGVHLLFEAGGPCAGMQQALHVRIVGGSHHETDSNETSYALAAGIAFREAAAQAGGDAA